MDIFSAKGGSVLGLGSAGTNSPSLLIPEANSQGYFTLSAGGGTGTAGRSWPFYKNALGTPYQVPASTALKVVALIVHSSTANVGGQLMSATATFSNNTAAPTGAVYQTGASANRLFCSATAYVPVPYYFPFSFAASLWPGFEFTDAVALSCIMVCKEIAA